MLFVMFSASVLSYTLKPFRRIPQIFPKILRRNRQKSPQIPSGPAYEHAAPFWASKFPLIWGMSSPLSRARCW